jgi:hypothetical protein
VRSSLSARRGTCMLLLIDRFSGPSPAEGSLEFDFLIRPLDGISSSPHCSSLTRAAKPRRLRRGWLDHATPEPELPGNPTEELPGLRYVLLAPDGAH